MYNLFSFLHFLGMGILIGGEPLVAMIAIKSEKSDNTLQFFVDFLWNIVIYMWVGMSLAFTGGVGMLSIGKYSIGSLFTLKLVLYILVVILSLFLLFNVSKVKKEASLNFSGLRSSKVFKRMDLLSKLDMVSILLIMIVSVLL